MIMWAAIDCMLIECCMALQQIVNADGLASFISSQIIQSESKLIARAQQKILGLTWVSFGSLNQLLQP